MKALLSDPLSVILVVFFFGFCVFIHEFGHLLAAMWRKLHIECFSIGFGKPIWKKVIKGIEYRISWIPFGGYVALPQLEPTDKPQTSTGQELPEAKPLDRIITAFAGPFFNIIFGFLLGGVVWMVGLEQEKKYEHVTVGFLPSFYSHDDEKHIVPEFEAGLRLGDTIVAVNGEALTNGLEQARNLILTAPGARVTLDVIRGEAENKEDLTIAYKAAPHPNPDFRGAGVPMFMQYYDTKVGDIDKESAAYKAGLRKDDVLVSINGQKVWSSQWLVSTLGALNPEPKPGLETYVGADFTINRDGEVIELNVKPEYVDPSETNGLEEPALKFGLYGIPKVEMAAEKKRPLPWEQFQDTIVMMGKTLRMISDKDNPVSIKALSGPVGIFSMMKRMFDAGLVQGLYLTVIISFSLALFNLLPLPILDGGHIVIAVVEGVFRRKIPPKVIQPVFYAFFAVIISFALYVTFFDVRQIVKDRYYLRQTTAAEDAQVIKELAEKKQNADEKTTVPEGNSDKS